MTSSSTTVRQQLPIPLAAAPGTVVSLTQLLTDAFGSLPLGVLSGYIYVYSYSAGFLSANTSSYWNPYTPQLGCWYSGFWVEVRSRLPKS